MLIDIKAVEEAANKELAEERAKAATGQIKAKLKAIEAAQAVVANLKREYAALLLEIGEA